jgi:hypothetical protein
MNVTFYDSDCSMEIVTRFLSGYHANIHCAAPHYLNIFYLQYSPDRLCDSITGDTAFRNTLHLYTKKKKTNLNYVAFSPRTNHTD